MISIVIPYVKTSNDDLKFALRSWEKYADFDYQIWLIGEPPEWYTGNSIKMDRIMFNVARDITCKLLEIVATDEITEDFIYTYDDVYLLKKTSLADLKRIIASRQVIRGEITPGNASRVWKMRFEETISQLQQNDLYGYETHLPRVLNKIILTKVISDFKLTEKDLMFSTLYFNKYFNPPEIILGRQDTIKLGLYEPKNYDQIKATYIDQQFMNHSDRGNTEGLRKFRSELFATVSKNELKIEIANVQ